MSTLVPSRPRPIDDSVKTWNGWCRGHQNAGGLAMAMPPFSLE